MNSDERARLRTKSLPRLAERLRSQGLSWGQVAERLGVSKDTLATRIALGERLLSLDDAQ
jgi:orotate phosphoribosyltransferase-like protein